MAADRLQLGLYVAALGEKQNAAGREKWGRQRQ